MGDYVNLKPGVGWMLRFSRDLDYDRKVRAERYADDRIRHGFRNYDLFVLSTTNEVPIQISEIAEQFAAGRYFQLELGNNDSGAPNKGDKLIADAEAAMGRVLEAGGPRRDDGTQFQRTDGLTNCGFTRVIR